MKEKLIRFPTIFDDRILVPWIQENVQLSSQLSRIDVWYQQSQEKDDMIIAIEDFKNILNYVDFSRLCYFISRFPELIP